MNLMSSRSSEKTSRRNLVCKSFSVISVILFFAFSVTSVFAYNVQQVVYFDGNSRQYPINTKHSVSYSDSVEGLSVYIDNSSPELFESGRHYTFDVVMGIGYGYDYTYTETMQQAINDLVTNGYSDTWFAHYVYGFDFTWSDINYNSFSFSPEQYYISPNECVVYYDGVCYTSMTEYLPDMQSVVVDASPNGGKLYIQVKIHFDFDVTAPINELYFTWNTYPFRPNLDLITAMYECQIDVSNIISYDYSSVGAMNTIAVDIKSQIAGMESALTSSLQDLLDQQDRYWELLLGGYELSNYDYGMGILYEVLDLQNSTLTTLNKINSTMTAVKTNTTNLVTHTVAIKNLLNGSTSTFWNFIEDNVDLIHTDLVDIKNYLDQTDKSSTAGADLGNSITGMMGTIDNNTGELVDVTLPEFSNMLGWNWFSQTINLIDVCIPFLIIALSFALVKVVLR